MGGGGGYGDDSHLSDMDRLMRSALNALEEQREERVDEIIDLIITHVTPGGWEPNGEIGSISEFDGMLIIGHTKSGHRRVIALLKMLREAQAARRVTAPALSRVGRTGDALHATVMPTLK